MLQKGSSLIFILLGILVLALIGGAYYLGKQSSKMIKPNQNLVSVPTPTPDPTANWKTYIDGDVTFKFPSAWIQNPKTLTGSGFSQEFTDPEKKYSLTFLVKGNYNQATGKPFVNIDEVVGMPYKVKAVVIDGQDGRQPLPRAGSENINSVLFFSKDSKSVLNIWMKTGDTALNTSETQIQQGQQLFDQIISTFKFIDQTSILDTSTWKTFTDNMDGFEFKYPSNFVLTTPNDTNFISIQNYFVGGDITKVSTVAFPDNYYPKTNFNEAWITFNISKGLNFSSCQTLHVQGSSINPPVTTKNINDLTFYTGTTDGAAAGNIYNTNIYHYFRDNNCYEISTTLHTGNIYNFSPSSGISAVNESNVNSIFDQIISTFKLN